MDQDFRKENIMALVESIFNPPTSLDWIRSTESIFNPPIPDSPYEHEREPIHIRTSPEWIHSKLKNNNHKETSHNHYFIVNEFFSYTNHPVMEATRCPFFKGRNVIHFQIPKKSNSRVYVLEYTLLLDKEGKKLHAEQYEYDVENVSRARTLYAHWISLGYSPIQ
jgi:hypothetical protein